MWEVGEGGLVLPVVRHADIRVCMLCTVCLGGGGGEAGGDLCVLPGTVKPFFNTTLKYDENNSPKVCGIVFCLSERSCELKIVCVK